MEGLRKRPLFWAILLLGSAAFVFHMVGFIAPGWIIVGLKPQPIDWIGNPEQFVGEGGGIRGGGRFEGDDIRDETVRPHPRHNFSTTEAPTWLWREKRQAVDIDVDVSNDASCGHVMETIMSTATARCEIALKYGIWFSTMCVCNHKKVYYSSGSDDEEVFHGRVVDEEFADKRCHCTKMSPTCFFETYDIFAIESTADPRIDRKGLGRKLTEHRVESTIGVVTCLIGLIFGAMAFRKEVRSKLFAAFGLVSMLVSCIIIALPLYRIGIYNVNMHHSAQFDIRPPFSVLCSAIGWFLALITALMISVGLLGKIQKQGGWYRFNNDAETQSVKEMSDLADDVTLVQ